MHRVIWAVTLFGAMLMMALGSVSLAWAQLSDTDAALAAALQQFNGHTEPGCGNDSPQQLACVIPNSSPETVQAGIAVFEVSNVGGDGGYLGVLGRTQAGQWQLWFTSQNPYQLMILPGDMLVCADGSGANLRSKPSTDADVVATLPDLTRVTADVFTLSDPGSDRVPGFGWFHVNAPQNGWVYSKYLADVQAAVGPDPCGTRNGQVDGN